MKVGLTIAANDVQNHRRSLTQMVDQAIRAEELGYDSVWVMDHIFIDRGDHVADPGPDPMILLGQIAAHTSRIELGTMVVCAPFRPPVQLAREAKALQEASQGRLILGVGAGWHQPEFDAYGFPFDHRVGRFEDYLEVLSRLLKDGRSSYEGTYHRLVDGQVFGPQVNAPWVAAFQPRMLEITARLAGGWHSGWHGADPDVHEERLALLANALSAAERSLDSMVISAGLLVLPVAGSELDAVAAGMERADLAEVAIIGDVAAVTQAIVRYREGGCAHAVLNFSPNPFTEVDSSYAERLAPALDRIRG